MTHQPDPIQAAIDALVYAKKRIDYLSIGIRSVREMNHDRSHTMPAIDTALKQLRAHQSEVAAQGWQPIETAPRDGSRILVSDGYYVDTAYFRAGEWWLYECGDDWYSMSFNPTDWKPLDSPPKHAATAPAVDPAVKAAGDAAAAKGVADYTAWLGTLAPEVKETVRSLHKDWSAKAKAADEAKPKEEGEIPFGDDAGDDTPEM